MVSSVTRLGGLYLTEDLLPNRADLLDMHRLLLGDPEEKRLATTQPVVVLDGCAHQCGSNFLWLLGLRPVLRFYLPGFLARYRLKPGTKRAVLIESGQKLARLMAHNAARLIKVILDQGYDFEPQGLDPGPVRVCDFAVEVEEALGYIDVLAACVHRPEEMPPLPHEENLVLDPPPPEG